MTIKKEKKEKKMFKEIYRHAALGECVDWSPLLEGCWTFDFC
jgi:hypothetical protein